MAITSGIFLVSILGISVIYYAIPQNWQWKFLTLVSMGAYLWYGGIKSLLILTLTILDIYFGAIFIEKYKESPKKRKIIFVITLMVAVGILAFYNYLNFFVWNINGIMNKFHMENALPVIRLIAPLGISFYSLSLISYLIDVYWDIQTAQKNFGKLYLFGIYFPVMTSGPIIRYQQMEGQLYKGYVWDDKRITFGIQRVIWGMYKKIVLADRLYIVVNTVYSEYALYDGISIIVATFCATLRLYLDFSACMDIVIGISEIFGIVLPENFEKPFSSLSVAEFFRRWHITLGQWLKDYIYFPIMKSNFIQNMGKKAKKKFGKRIGKLVSTFAAMFVLWFCNGIWHGGAWKYIIGTGLGFWVYMLIGEILLPYRKRITELLHINTEAGWYKNLRKIGIVIIYSTIVVFFYVNSFTDGLRLYKHAISNFSVSGWKPEFLLGMGVTVRDIAIIAVGLAVYGAVVLINRKTDVRKWMIEKNIVFRWTAYYVIIFMIILFGIYGSGYDTTGFAYAQF